MLKKILIVDDSEFIIEIMTYILNNRGYDVIALNNGDGVFDHIKTDHPDLIILDVVLPGADGRDICQEIKRNAETSHLPIIICTGSIELELQMHQPGSPNDVLYKPFNVDSLINMVTFQLAA